MPTRIFVIQSFWTLTLLTLLCLGGGVAQATDNTVLGGGAGTNLGADAHDNTLIGFNAGTVITDSDSNTLVGNLTGFNNTTGKFNAFFGDVTGIHTTTGSFNTFLGRGAGFNNKTGSSNVFVGVSAGSDELGSNKLYIDNSSTSAPLIYGDFTFGSELVGINGALGVGTQIPLDALHVRNGNFRIEQPGATHAILKVISNRQIWEIKNNSATGRLTFFSPGGGATTGSFKFDRQAVENLLRVGVLTETTVDINGDLVVTGSINPDYVFTPEFHLETIEAHAAYMWAHRHLPAVGPGQMNAQGQGMVNVGLRSQGMLEELEKAHIYIEQLHGQMDAIKGDNAKKKEQIATLTGEVTVNSKDLDLLKIRITEKQMQLEHAQWDIEQLQGDMTTLKALVHHLLGQNLDGVPGEEG